MENRGCELEPCRAWPGGQRCRSLVPSAGLAPSAAGVTRHGYQKHVALSLSKPALSVPLALPFCWGREKRVFCFPMNSPADVYCLTSGTRSEKRVTRHFHCRADITDGYAHPVE